MMGFTCKMIVAFGMCLAASGCDGILAKPLPPIRVQTAGIEPSADYSDLSAVLKKAVNDEGLLDSYDLKKVMPQLDRQLARLAVTGPDVTPGLFPTAGDNLAYWYNASAAWAIKLAAEANCPQTLSHARLEGRPFPLDGREMSLEEIDRMLSAMPDWRVVVAAPSTRLHRAALPREAFRPGDVQSQVPERFNAYMEDDRRFIIDVDHKQILAPPVLWRQRDRLIYEYNRLYHTQGADFLTALGPHVHGLALYRLQNAIGYPVTPETDDGPVACVKQ